MLEREVVRQLQSETTCCGVTLAQCHALLELADSELSLTNLSSALDLDTSTLSRTVDGMVKAGLVQRREDAADRRSLRLTLSEAGRARAGTINEMCNRFYAAVLKEMTDADRRSVIRGVRLLADILRRARLAAPAGASCCSTEPRREPRRHTKKEA